MPVFTGRMLPDTQPTASKPSYPPDNHHSSDLVYWREGDIYLLTTIGRHR